MKKLSTALRVYRKEGWMGIARVLKLKTRPLYKKIRCGHVLGDRLSALLPEQASERRLRDAKGYWSESEESKRVQDLSHWRDEGRWQDNEKWVRIGQKHFEKWEKFKKACEVDNINGKMIEWGPGGGSNVVRFAQEFDEVYGVDISASNLAECERQFRAQGAGTFHPVLIPAECPLRCQERLPTECDLFLSTAVFQHFPSKEYGAEVLKLVHMMLRDEGAALIQIRYDDLTRKYSAKKRDYERHAITFTSYPIHEFWNMLIDAGLTPRFVQLEPHVNYAYYYAVK